MTDEIERDDSGRFAKGNSGAFKPGKEWTGNAKGRPPGRTLEAELRRVLDNPDSGVEIVQALIESAIQQALRGDFKYWKEIFDRDSGRLVERIAGEDGRAITFLIEQAQRPEDASDGG